MEALDMAGLHTGMSMLPQGSREHGKKNANKHTLDDIATMGPSMFENRWTLEHGRYVNRCVKATI